MSGEPPVVGPGPLAGPRRVPVVNVANALTLGRIVLIPVFAGFVVASGMTGSTWRIAACVVFIVASATDFVDGWIARSWDLVTPFGKVADPIADKALIGTALLLLSGYGRVSWWVTAVILLREFGVTVLRFLVIRYGVIAASRGGKVKTALQILGIGWYLWPFPPGLAQVGPYVIVAAVVATLATGVDYVLRALRIQRLARTGPREAELARLATEAEPGSPSVPTVAPVATPAERKDD
jgi:CDP-diacylglycerol--glycerol-3-phosphate 3-phosphatidyltransferase